MNIFKIERTPNMNYFETHQNSLFPPNISEFVQNEDCLLLPSSNIIQTSMNNNVHELDFQAYSCTSSTSNEAENNNKQQLDQTDERKHRRMVSNRESARRSRMRKKRQINELWSMVVSLKNENQDLMEKLNHASEFHTQIIMENSELKEETCNLRAMLNNHMQLGTNHHDDHDDDDHNLDNTLRDLEDL